MNDPSKVQSDLGSASPQQEVVGGFAVPSKKTQNLDDGLQDPQLFTNLITVLTAYMAEEESSKPYINKGDLQIIL